MKISPMRLTAIQLALQGLADALSPNGLEAIAKHVESFEPFGSACSLALEMTAAKQRAALLAAKPFLEEK